MVLYIRHKVIPCLSNYEKTSDFLCCHSGSFFTKHLKELQNFNGLMAVAGGLTNSVLSRLRQTQELLSEDCREVLLSPC